MYDSSNTKYQVKPYSSPRFSNVAEISVVKNYCHVSLLSGASKIFVKLGSVIIFKNVIFLPDFWHGFEPSCSIAELSRKF